MTKSKSGLRSLPLSKSVSLQTLMVCVSYIPICVGAAMAIRFEAWYLAEKAFHHGWERRAQKALFDILGVSEATVDRLVVQFAIGRVPSWICFALLTFVLAYSKSNKMRLLAVVFLFFAPVGVATFEHTILFMSLWRGTILLLTGALLSCLAFGCAFGLRQLRPFPSERTSIGYMDIAVIASLVCLSARGWYLFPST